MGPLTFNSQSYPQLKQTRSFSLLPPSSSPAYSLSQNLKPKLMPSHGWLTLTWDMPDGHTPLDMLPTQPPMDLDTTDTLLDTLELTSSEREKLTPKPRLTYANYGYAGYPYAATYGAYAYPSVYNTAYAAPVATYAGVHLIGKREAEADSEAKPWLTYANYGYAGYPYAATYAAGAYAYPSVYSAAYARPVATYAGAHLIGKREAEADSWYGYSGYASPYTTYGGYASYRPYTYGRVYGAYGYGW